MSLTLCMTLCSGVLAGQCNYSDPLSCVNTLDTTYNFPLVRATAHMD